VPGRFPLFREAALVLFLIAVALGLWLAELRPLAVVGVMALALAVAWVIEWFSWREDQIRGAVPMTGAIPPEAVPPDAVPPVTVPPEAAQPEAAEESVPVPAPPPRARGLWLRRGRASEPAEAEPAPPAPAELVESEGTGHAPPAAEPTAPEAEAESAPPARAAPEEEKKAALQTEEPPPSRRRLQPVRSATPEPTEPAGAGHDPPAPAAPTPPAAVPQGAPVVPLWARSSQPREWNLWDLERIARAQSRFNPERSEEWSYLFLHLRRFANADGVLPAEFDGLVRDSFGGILEPSPHA
jgi:hypothetical protein